MKIVIVGGGAGGASCAARLRRLSNNLEITVLEKTNETSMASCGLPYYIGDVIDNRDVMQVASPQLFKDLFAIDVLLNHEAVKINVQDKNVQTVSAMFFRMISWCYPLVLVRVFRQLPAWIKFRISWSKRWPMPSFNTSI